MKSIIGYQKFLFLSIFLLTLSSCQKDSAKVKDGDIKRLSNLKGDPSSFVVSTYAGSAQSGNLDGPLLEARFSSVYGIVSTPGGTLYITDRGNGNIRKISPDGLVTTVPFKRLSNPLGITIGTDESLYFTEEGNNRIRKITADDKIIALELCEIGPDGEKIPMDIEPLDLAISPDGTIYIVGNDKIIKRTTDGVGTIFAGGEKGFNDGKGTEAKFSSPVGIALAPDGNLYVADAGNNCYRKVSPDGDVTTIAGSLTPGYDDGIGSAATFREPRDVIVVDNQTLIVSDLFKVRRISLPEKLVTTIAGTPSPGGYIDGPALSAKFSGLHQITVYNNELYIPDEGVRRIRKVSSM